MKKLKLDFNIFIINILFNIYLNINFNFYYLILIKNK